MTSPGCARRAAAEIVLSILAAEPSWASLPFGETWYSRAEDRETQAAKARRTMKRAVRFMAILRGLGVETGGRFWGLCRCHGHRPHSGRSTNLSFVAGRGVVNCPGLPPPDFFERNPGRGRRRPAGLFADFKACPLFFVTPFFGNYPGHHDRQHWKDKAAQQANLRALSLIERSREVRQYSKNVTAGRMGMDAKL